MSEQVMQIFIPSIVPNPDNRRVGGFDPVKIEQLAASIKDVGVQQPIIVRKSLGSGGYELVAGERRVKACVIAGLKEIPAIVRELDDLQVLKIQTIENLQREDVHPLDEADGFARLIEKAGYEVDQVAAELGKSASYVYQRLKLRDLVPGACDLFVKGDITAGHAILIARLPAAQQEEIIKEELFEGYQKNRQAVPVRDLSDYIQRDLLMSLSKAPWKWDDANLLPEAGPCTLCPKRTDAQPALFADVCNGGKKSFCLDRSCFNAKASASLKLRELELSGAPLIRLSEHYGATNTSSRYDVTECKKDAKGAVRTLTVDGPNVGKIGWAIPRGQQAGRQAAKENPKEIERLRKERAKKILDNKVARRMHRLIWETVTAAAGRDLKKNKDKLPLAALRLVVGALLKHYWGGNSRFIDEVGQPLSANVTYSELLLTLVQILVSPALDPDSVCDYGLDDAKKLATIYGVDLKAIERQAKEDAAKPKGPKLVNISKDGKAAAKKKTAKKKNPEYLDMLEAAE